MEFKITSMNLLAESIDKFVTGIQITLKINDIDDDLIRRLPKIFKKYPGKAAIEIKVTDSEDKLTLNLLSRKTKVNPSEFLREMEAFPDVKLSLRHPS